jgi:hypothetical protein
MDEQQQEAFDEHDLETQRSTIRQSFDEIVSEIRVAMQTARLTFPLGITIPSSGFAFITMVTPEADGDVSEADWEQASVIVRNVVSKKLGGIRLRSNHLRCSMVNSTMNATEITSNALNFDTRL